MILPILLPHNFLFLFCGGADWGLWLRSCWFGVVFLQLRAVILQVRVGFLQLRAVILQPWAVILQVRVVFLQVRAVILQLRVVILQLRALFLQVRVVFLQLHAVILRLWAVFLQLRTRFLQLPSFHICAFNLSGDQKSLSYLEPSVVQRSFQMLKKSILLSC